MTTVHPHRVLSTRWQLLVTQSHWRQWCSYSITTISVERGEALQCIWHPISFSSIPYLSEIIKNQDWRLFLSWQLRCFTMNSLKTCEVCKKDCTNTCLLAMNQSDWQITCRHVCKYSLFFPMLRSKAYISIVRKCFITLLILRFTYTAKIWEKKEKTKAKPKRSRSGMCFKLWLCSEWRG